METVKEIILKQERPDSIELRQLAGGKIAYTIKIYTDFNNEEEALKKLKSIKDRVEKMLNVEENYE